jgi:hypothetical protein
VKVWGTKPWGSRSSGVCFPGVGPRGLWSSAAGTKEPNFWVAGALWPDFPHRIQGAQISGTASGWGETSLCKRESEVLSSCMCQEADWLQTACRVMEPGSVQWLQGQGIGNAELQIVLPILPMASCFSICRFGVGFASHCLCDTVGVFRVLWSSFFRVVGQHWAVGMSTTHHLGLPLKFYLFFNLICSPWHILFCDWHFSVHIIFVWFINIVIKNILVTLCCIELIFYNLVICFIVYRHLGYY